MDNAFLGFLPMVKKENMAEKYKRKSDVSAVHLWREDLLEEIKAVLKNRMMFSQSSCHPDFHLFGRGTSSRLNWKMIRPKCTGNCTN